MIAEHSLVVLNRDLVSEGLSAGDIGAVVFVHRQDEAYEVEFVDGDGSTIALVTLKADDVRHLAPGELLHARRRN